MDHTDVDHQCQAMSDCPYTGTTVINKTPWADWPAGEDDEETIKNKIPWSGPGEEEEIIIEEHHVATVRERILSFEKRFSKYLK